MPLRQSGRHVMNWETPAYCEIRLGFEVTAYVYVR
ncbi:MAG: pyrroloquinoline quinone precursor peptide PqqA [Azospira sp.]|nr:pyrroloquinoline quinone precursor peptide PqqA [Azospira sp.]